VATAEHATSWAAQIGAERIDALRRRATAERRWSLVSIALGVSIIVAIPAASGIVPLLRHADPNAQNFEHILAPPSLAHPFGTDNVGRDVLARVFAATPLDYEVALITTGVALVIGVIFGALAGYFGGWSDALIMRTVDVMSAFPFLVFVLAFVAVFGTGLTGIYVGLILFGWAFFARVTRAEMLTIRERQYISASRTLGLPTWRTLIIHALPNVLRPNLVIAMATIVWNILTLATLSYLGVGVQPPTAEWGSIVADGQTYLLSDWWLSTLPGLVIVLVGAGFSLIGDGIADRLGYDFRLTV
jgi:peptide/nickel transport system permease protein